MNLGLEYDLTVFGKYIKDFREKIGYKTSKAFAEKIGVSNATISNWELGIKSPDIDKCVILSRLFGITLDDLLSANRDKLIDYSSDFSEYIKEKNHIKKDFLKHSFESQRSVLLDQISIYEKYKFYMKKLINSENLSTDELKEFNDLSSIVKIQFIPKSTSYEFSYCVISKQKEEFDLEKIVDIIYPYENHIGFSSEDDKEEIHRGRVEEDLFMLAISAKKIVTNLEVYSNDKNEEFVVVDNKGNKATVYYYSLPFGVLDVDGLLDCKKIIEEFNFNFTFSEFINDYSLFMPIEPCYSGMEPEINELTEQLLFGNHIDLLTSYLNAIYQKEKDMLFQKYLNRCLHRELQMRVDVLYAFICADAKLINESKTLFVAKETLKALYRHKEYVSFPLDDLN